MHSHFLPTSHISLSPLPAVLRHVLYCLLTLVGTMLPAVEAWTQDLEADKKALEALYNATGGPNWKNNTNWLSAEPIGDWRGVTVTNGRVTRLRLRGNQLAGTIPAQLGNLANLQTLELDFNRLEGAIPAQLGNLASLQTLDLNDNRLTGSIPSQLGNLANLQSLDLDDNRLEGAIPAQLGNLASLQTLDLNDNRLTGSIPSQLGNLAKLESLRLARNQLTGTIPSQLGNLAKLRGLYLQSNQLTGTIPSQLGSLTNLEFLWLFGNQLTGTIPTQLANLANLESLHLGHNQLTGTIPPQLGNLANLWSLYLRYNLLTGTIPTQLGNLGNLNLLDFEHNRLAGSIPTELANLTGLAYLYLSHNLLTGDIPVELGNLANLQELLLGNNQLTGTLPSSFTGLVALDTLHFYLNPGLCAQDDTSIRTWLHGIRVVLGPDCSPTVRLSATPSRLFEGAGPTPVTVTAERKAASSPTTVTLRLGGSAREGPGGDYTRHGPRSITIPANTNSGNTLLTFTPLEDGVVEGDENIILEAVVGTKTEGSFKLSLIDTQSACSTRDRVALAALYKTTGGPNWFDNTNWLSDQPLSAWHGVTVDSNGCVTELRLPDNQLTGAVPAQLGNLDNLVELWLHNNQLAGEIPPELGNLALLEQLLLHNNHLTGTIPASFTNLGALEFFSFYGNTDLIVPGDPALQTWLSGITNLQGHDYIPPGATSAHFVPVILTASGLNNSFFTSELTLTNRGSQTAALHYTHTATPGGRSAQASETLAPGRQKIVPNAIDHLRTLGVPIPPTGNRIGTLRVEVSGSDVGVTVRTTSRVADGRAGLSYPGVAVAEGFEETVYLCGLRQNSQDRSNVALQNMGMSQEGSITLRTTAFSGDPNTPGSQVLPDVTLRPGEFHQFSGLLATSGIAQGYVKVERVSGRAPFYAYGVINDQANSDGSFVFPVTAGSLAGVRGQTLPVIIENPNFSSELIVTNFSSSTKEIDFRFVADAIARGDRTASFSMTLRAGEQQILPEIVENLRRQGVDGLGQVGLTLAGAVFAEGNDLSGVVIGARTGSPGGGGQYSVFYNAVPYGAAFSDAAWVDALQQNAESRSNLALVNTGEVDDSDSIFRLEIYDGVTGRRANTVTGIRIRAQGWHQINVILANYATGTTQGYVRVRKTAGNNPFLAYGVINDGGAPGQRSGDGAYLPAQQ